MLEIVSYGELESGYDLNASLMKNGLVKVSCPKPLSVEKFELLAHSLGKPLVTDKHVVNKSRTVQENSSTGLFASGDVDWHHDWSYGRGNYFGTILYNVKNAHLSPTWFCNMSKAPNELKNLYRDAIGEYYPPQHLHETCFTEKQLSLLEKQKVSRPYVINHYVTGEEILYCSWSTLRNINVDIEPIKQWVEDNAYIHRWEENDILIWDNLKMNHKRVAFEGERVLWRTQFLFDDDKLNRITNLP